MGVSRISFRHTDMASTHLLLLLSPFCHQESLKETMLGTVAVTTSPAHPRMEKTTVVTREALAVVIWGLSAARWKMGCAARTHRAVLRISPASRTLVAVDWQNRTTQIMWV